MCNLKGVIHLLMPIHVIEINNKSYNEAVPTDNNNTNNK